MDINFFNDNLEENVVKIQHKDVKLFLIKNIFDDDSFKELQSEIMGLMLDSENWEKVDGQELINRKVLKLNGSKFIDNINKDLKKSKLLNYINKIMDESYSSCSFRVWWDTADYYIGWHCDNDNIDTSMQIYVTDIIHNHLGTAFAYVDNNSSAYNIPRDFPFLTLPYIQNTGYLFKNTNTIRHGMTMRVPDGFDRVSLYFYIN
jgi:hypothetical protein